MDISIHIQPTVEEGFIKASDLTNLNLHNAIACVLDEAVDYDSTDIISKFEDLGNFTQNVIPQLIKYLQLVDKPFTTQNELNDKIVASLRLSELLVECATRTFKPDVTKSMQNMRAYMDEEHFFIKKFPHQAQEAHANR